MNTTHIIRTIFEIALVAFAIWAVFHEDLFIAIEERILSLFKRKKLKVVEGRTFRVIK